MTEFVVVVFASLIFHYVARVYHVNRDLNYTARFRSAGFNKHIQLS